MRKKFKPKFKPKQRIISKNKKRNFSNFIITITWGLKAKDIKAETDKTRKTVGALGYLQLSTHGIIHCDRTQPSRITGIKNKTYFWCFLNILFIPSPAEVFCIMGRYTDLTDSRAISKKE